MSLEWDIPRQEKTISMHKCYHCGHWYETEALREGNCITPIGPCEECGEEQG